MKLSSSTRIFLLELLGPVVFVIAWYFLSKGSTDPYFPPLTKMWEEFKDVYIWDRFSGDVLYSLKHFVYGVSLGLTVGFVAGMILGLSPRTRRNIAPITEFFRATPIVALIPIGLIMFGPGTTIEMLLIALAVNWPVLMNTADGIRGVDPALPEVARSYGLSRRQQIFKIMLPAAMPQIMSGVRVSVGLAVAVMVVTNMFANGQGLGARVVAAQANFDILGSWAGIFMIAFVGITITVIYTLIHNRVLAWHHGWRATAGTN